ncbi:MAG: MFS transporter [Chlamydiia bacterium]|nr:MFS transporter [Chlamydiia bacterium]
MNILSRSRLGYLIFLLSLVLADVIGVNYILKAFSQHTPFYQFVIVVSLLFLQIFFSPIQTGFSDFYCRKKTLVIALICSLISIMLVYSFNRIASAPSYIPVLVVGIKGCLGNVIPLCWATIADIQERKPRFSFGLATGGYAVGYLVLVASNRFLSQEQIHFTIIFLFVLLTLICILFVEDTRDKLHVKERKKDSFVFLFISDNKLILEDLCVRYLRSILVSFLLWEISLYAILLFYIDFFTNQFSLLPVGMMIGYLSGIGLLKFCQGVSDLRMIRIGYYFSIISLLPIFIVFPFVKHIESYLLVVCYFFHSMGNAFLCPTLFTIISKTSPAHAWGRKYGLVESSDSVAFLVAFVMLLACQAVGLGIGTIVSISFLSITLSLLPYREFCKVLPKNLH